MLRFDAAGRSTASKRPIRQRGQLPVWRLTPLAPPAIGRSPGRGAATARSSAASCRSARSQPGFAADAGGADPTRAVGRLDRGLLHLQPGARRSIATPCARMLAAIAAPAGFAFVEEAGQPMAMAIGAVEGDHMGLFDVLVMPQARRRGLARQGHREPLRLGVAARRALRLSAGRRHQRSGDAALRRAGLPHGLRLRVLRAALALTLRPPRLNSRAQGGTQKWRTILGKRATRPA